MRTSSIQPPLGTNLNKGNALCQGLAASWLMNEGGGVKIFDGTGRNNVPGVLTNGAVFKQGLKGNCVSFDGVNDYIDAGNNAALSPGTSNFSISVWIWAANANQAGVIVQKRSAATFPLYTLSVDDNVDNLTSGKRIGVGFLQTNTFARTYDTTASIVDGNWHHIVATWAISTNAVTLYVDGVNTPLTTRTATNTITTLTMDTSLKIGSNTGSGAFFTGLMNNLKIYNRELSGTEVRQLYYQPYSMFVGYKGLKK